jgi:hypothetical protein
MPVLSETLIKARRMGRAEEFMQESVMSIVMAKNEERQA